MKTFLVEELAEKYAGKISFIHIYSGLARSPVFYSHVKPLWFRIVWRVLKPLVSWYMTSPEVCGDYHAISLHKPVPGESIVGKQYR